MKHHLILRYSFFLLGLLINSFGIVLITKGNLGTSPISSVPYVLSLFTSLSFGEWTFILNMLFILIQVLLLGKKFPPVQFLQIVANFIFSAFIDLSMMLTTWLVPGGIVSRVLLLLVGCIVLAFGITIEVAPKVITVPGEGIVKVISDVFHLKFDRVKNCFDITLMCIALVISLCVFHGLRGIGIGTVISAILVGRIVGFLNQHFSYSKKISALAD